MYETNFKLKHHYRKAEKRNERCRSCVNKINPRKKTLFKCKIMGKGTETDVVCSYHVCDKFKTEV